MKTLKLITIVSIISVLTQSCYKNGGPWGIRGKGSVIEEKRDVTGFNRIDLSINADVTYTQDSIFRLEVSGQENILRVLETEVKGTELVIGFKRNVWEHSRIKIVVHSPDMRSIELSGSGDVHVVNRIVTSDLELNISGSGNVSVPLINVSNFTAKISGSGNMTVSGGTVTTESFEVTGSGDIDALNVIAKTNSSKISGSGSMDVHVTDKLKVNISGSGDVRYRGRPVIDSEISGSGKLTHLD